MNQEIINTIVNSSNAEDFEIHYKDGTVFEGFLSSVKNNFETVILTPHVGKSHKVDFLNIEKLIVKQFGNVIQTLNNY